MPTTLLVPLDVAKRHCRDESSLTAGDMLTKVQQASAIVMDYLKSRADPGWIDGTVAVPKPVEAATLLLVAHLNENRGDNMAPDLQVWAAVERLLVRFRDPALA